MVGCNPFTLTRDWDMVARAVARLGPHSGGCIGRQGEERRSMHCCSLHLGGIRKSPGGHRMSDTVFTKVDFSLGALMDAVQMGTIGLPDIQRPFVWKNAKVRNLFASALCGHQGHPRGARELRAGNHRDRLQSAPGEVRGRRRRHPQGQILHPQHLGHLGEGDRLIRACGQLSRRPRQRPRGSWRGKEAHP
jgi:hypothetical protein